MDVQIPSKDPRLLVQTWDVELLTPNDALAEADLSLKGLFGKAAQNKLRQTLKGLSVNMTHPNYGGVQSVIKLDVVPGEEARQQPAVHGRSGDQDLEKDFKRPPGAFSKMLGNLSPFGAMKKYLIIACVVISIVAVLGLIVVL